MLTRVCGIYNLDTYLLLRDLGVRHFVFDFRPTSLNFIQLHVAKDIMDHSQEGDVFGIKIGEEPEHVVGLIWSELRSRGEVYISSEHWHVGQSVDADFELVLREGWEHAHPQSLAVHFDLVEESYKSESELENIQRNLRRFGKIPKWLVGVDTSIVPRALLEGLGLTGYELAIGPTVERSYRVVHRDRLQKCIRSALVE